MNEIIFKVETTKFLHFNYVHYFNWNFTVATIKVTCLLVGIGRCRLGSGFRRNRGFAVTDSRQWHRNRHLRVSA